MINKSLCLFNDVLKYWELYHSWCITVLNRWVVSAFLVSVLYTEGLSAVTLYKDGGQTLILGATSTTDSGSNITGALIVDQVQINAGTIQIGADTAIGASVPVSIASGATLDLNAKSISIGTLTGASGSFIILGGSDSLTVTQSSSTAFNGVISNTGSLIKTGSGTLTLGGTNTYSVATTLSAGGISLTNSSGLGTSALAMSDTTTLTLGAGISPTNAVTIAGTSTVTVASGTGTLGGAITSSGNLTKTGAGILALTSGSNNYSGGTTISTGTLALSGSGTLLSTGAVSIASGAAFDISGTTGGSGRTVGDLSAVGGSSVALGNRNLTFGTSTSSLTVAGVISDTGTGSITKQGSGTVILSAANTYGGGTTVSAGTLTGNSATFGTGPIACNATIDFDQTVNGTFGQNITGAGTFVKTGAAMLTLSGTVTQATALVNAGTLMVTGTLAASTTVASGAILKGTGTVGTLGATLTNFGTVQPGASIGTLTVIGDYIAENGSVLEIEFDPSNSDLLDISGMITIQSGAILSIFPDPTGPYPSSIDYLIVRAAGGGATSGAQFTVTSSLPSFDATVQYTPTEIHIIVSSVPVNVIVVSGNAAQVAHCLAGTTAVTGSDLAFVNNLLQFMQVDQLTATLNTMQPSLFNAFDMCEEETLVNVRNAVTKWQTDFDRKQCPSDNRVQIWHSYFYTQSHQTSVENQSGFHTETQAGLTGVNGRLSSEGSFGFAFAYTDDRIRWEETNSSAHVRSYYGNVYAGYIRENLYMQFVAMGGANTYDANRNIIFPATGLPGMIRTATHDGWGMSVLGSGEMGLIFTPCSTLECRPFGRFDYTYIHRFAATETGANSLDLYLDPHDAQFMRGEVGLDFFGCYQKGAGAFFPHAKAAYVFERRFGGANSQASFLFSPSCVMDVVGMQPDRAFLAYSIGVDVKMFSDSLLVGVEWEGQSGEHFWSSNTTAQLKWAF